MREKVRLYAPVIYILTAALLLCEAAVAVHGPYVVYTVSGFVVAALLLAIGAVIYANREADRYIAEMAQKISDLQSSTLVDFPLPIVASNDGRIVWYNNRAKDDVFADEEWYARPVDTLYGEDHPTRRPFDCAVGETLYTAYPVSGDDESGIMLYYMIDDTRWKKTAEQFEKTRPSVFLITVDNFGELQRYARDHDRMQLLAEIEQKLRDWFDRYSGLLIKTDPDRYVALVEEQYLDEIIENRFSVLDEIRALSVDQENLSVTLSIGLARRCDGFPEGETVAQQALDMAQGRGGDQAAVKTPSGYDFYGGISKGVERRTKVKTRIIATAMRELILSSDFVIMMGHKFADYDAFGASVGLLNAVRQMGRRGVVAINRSRNLVGDLLRRLEETGYENSFYNPADVLPAVGEAKNPLLIIVDTHLEHVLDSPELYRACPNVVVIDHHRRMVGYIENGVIFYHEPYASSASEMVTELIQYFGTEVQLERSAAEALLAGIMLDTKNFSVRTGARTFEAAAYLRRQGADTAEVRKLFTSTISDYRQRARLVSSADIVSGCAIAQTDSVAPDIRIIAAQAADEMLNLAGVQASFVLYLTDDGVSISARSMGARNVQVIMEALGGGGHQTMAAAQLDNTTLNAARQRLIDAIEADAAAL